MLNSVILTIRVEQSRKEYDLELPANIPGEELCWKLLAALKNVDNQAFRFAERISLRINQNGKMLGATQTLEDAEIWDGSILSVMI